MASASANRRDLMPREGRSSEGCAPASPGLPDPPPPSGLGRGRGRCRDLPIWGLNDRGSAVLASDLAEELTKIGPICRRPAGVLRGRKTVHGRAQPASAWPWLVKAWASASSRPTPSLATPGGRLSVVGKVFVQTPAEIRPSVSGPGFASLRQCCGSVRQH